MKLIPALAGAALALAFGVVSAQAQYYLPSDKIERNREKLARKQAEFYQKYGYPQQRPGAQYRQAPPPGYTYPPPPGYRYAPPPQQVYRRPPPQPRYGHDMPGYGYVVTQPPAYRRAPEYYYYDDD